MKLSIGEIHDLYLALTALERNEDNRFKAEVRLAIAVNLNALQPLAAAYERARARAFADIEKEEIAALEKQVKQIEVGETLRAVAHQVAAVKCVKIEDLELDKNHKVTGALLAPALPILKGVG